LDLSLSSFSLIPFFLLKITSTGFNIVSSCTYIKYRINFTLSIHPPLPTNTLPLKDLFYIQPAILYPSVLIFGPEFGES
jgi:hypothetical protein